MKINRIYHICNVFLDFKFRFSKEHKQFSEQRNSAEHESDGTTKGQVHHLGGVVLGVVGGTTLRDWAVFGSAVVFEDGFHLDLLNKQVDPLGSVENGKDDMIIAEVIEEGVASHRLDHVAESLRICDGTGDVTGGHNELDWHLVDGVNAGSDKRADQGVSCREVWHVLLEAAYFRDL